MDILLDVEVTFETASGQTHAPMVRATVNGSPTLLILDTGSTDHLLTTELTRRLGLDLDDGEEGTDSSGASVRSWVTREARVGIADRAFELRGPVVIDPPPPFSSGGIGGILSPQHLDPDAWAVLDLADARFRLVAAADEMLPWLRESHPDCAALVLEPVDGEGTLLVRAGIDAHPPVVTMIDTGARTTQFAAEAVPDLATGSRTSAGRGVGGTESFGVEATDVELVAGGTRLRVPRLLVVAGHGEAQGLVAMDLVRGTVLAIGPGMRTVIWLVPEERLES